jgi:SPP1 gp7 family putative phage head morphogenesis protein
MLVANARRTDPTQTKTLRAQYERACVSRFKRLRKDIIASIVDRDCFALQVRSPFVLKATEIRQFDFPRSEDKVAAFMDWLRAEIDTGILEVQERTGTRIAGHTAWQNLYIRSAYLKGNEDAIRNIEALGLVAPQPITSIVFPVPLHADRLGLLFTRNFEDLRGITREMSRQIAIALTEGLSRAQTPIQIAKAITDRVDKIGLTRARTLARTEIIRAHAEATLNTYEQAGILEVETNPEIEIATAGDTHVCPQCKAKAYTAGGTLRRYTLAQARGLLPVHPNCRCAFLPVVESAAIRKAA